MLSLILGALAVLAGGFLGFWAGKSSATTAARAEAGLLREQLKGLSAEKFAAQEEVRGLQRSGATLQAQVESIRAEAAAEARNSTALRGEIERLRAELAAKSSSEAEARVAAGRLETALQAERAKLAEQDTFLQSAQKTLSDHFRALASGILDEKSKNFSEGSQKELGTLLDPLKAQIKEFREKVEQAQTDSKTGVAKLEGMIGNLSGLNQKIAAEAENLATALRGSAKAQGDWGEFILRDLLEKAGLREGEQYSFQQAFTGLESEEGGGARTVRTDVIVNLPGGRNLVIDSKVSLTAYTDSVNAASEAERAAALKLHLTSVRKHIDELARAGYHKLPGVEAPDFVVMFVPVEPAFLAALAADPELWAEAYKRNILLVGPTTLLYVIRIVNVLWQQEAQTKNVRDVMDRGAELYDKFVNFVGDLEKVGSSLRSADTNYTNAMKKLAQGRGNLVRQAEMLKELGVRSTKSLPQRLVEEAEEPNLALAAASDEERSE